MTETAEPCIVLFSIVKATTLFTPSTSSTISSELSTTNYKTESSSTALTMIETAEPCIVLFFIVITTTILTPSTSSHFHLNYQKQITQPNVQAQHLS
jgi:hypothetical protein